MGFKAKAFSTGVLVSSEEFPSDVEKILKHPFLLRVRCFLAKWRIIRRQRKLAKFNSRQEALIK